MQKQLDYSFEVLKLSAETRELIRQLRKLNENIDTLAKVTAVNIGQEEIFKGRETKEEKIEILDKMGLPNNLIAIITGSTPHSVSQFKSVKKPKPSEKKTATRNMKSAKEGVEQQDEQRTV